MQHLVCYLKKAISMAPSILCHKAVFKAKRELEKLSDTFYKPSYKGIKLLQSQPTIPLGFSDIKRFRDTLSKEEICHERELLEKGKFFFLGLEGHKIPSGVWNQDFISGFVWENAYFMSIKTVDLQNSADVKIPWELSRLQHLIVYVNHYLLQGDKGDLVVIRNTIKNWAQENPYKYSVNWTCSMEVAIRAINLIFLALMVGKDLFDTDEDWNFFCSLLYDHGRYIYKNLENYDALRNNHYLSDLLGLVWLALFLRNNVGFREKKVCNKWFEFSCEQMEKELDIQVNPDGTNYESSIAYHRLVTEIYLLYVYIKKVYKLNVNSEVLSSLNRMLAFMQAILKSNGSLPMIGDADDGRIIIFSDYYKWNRRGCDFILKRISQYLSGDLGLPFDEIPLPDLRTIAFKNGGYYLLRDELIYCMIHCGPLSMNGHGGHSHNDQLGVILSFKGEDFIIDPGSGQYSGDIDMRNSFRSTGFHSTMEAYGQEQNDMQADRIFEMHEWTHSRCDVFTADEFRGQHYGFSQSGFIHQRNVKRQKEDIIITDRKVPLKEAKVSVKWRSHFILSPGVSVIKISAYKWELHHNGVCVCMSSSVPLSCAPITVSTSYRVLVSSFRISSEYTEMNEIITEFKEATEEIS